MFIIFLYIIYLVLDYFIVVGHEVSKGNFASIKFTKSNKIMVGVIPGIIVLILVVNFILSPIFSSRSYAKRIEIIEGKIFEEEVREVDFNKVPLLDKASTEKIGDRVMGEMTDLV